MTLLSDLTPRREVNWTSYSGLTLHRKCPEAWSYRHLWGLRQPPKEGAKVELRFGSWWHALVAADAIERGRASGSLRWAPESLGTVDEAPRIPTDTEGLWAAVLEAAEAWEKTVPEEHQETWHARLGGMPTTLLEPLFARWARFWEEERRIEEPVAVEVKWSRELPGGFGVDLIGYTDEVYFDTKRQMLVVRDHKTGKELPKMSTANDMMDSQLHLNAWGLKDRCDQWGMGPIGAVRYDRVVSVRPTMPKLTQKGFLNKQVTRYDLSTYQMFCELPETKARGYEPEPEIIERLSRPDAASAWFQRTLTPVNRNIARVHLQAAIDSVHDSRLTIERVNARGEAPRNLSGAACRYCDFAELCRARMIGGPEGEYELEQYGLVGPKPRS